MTVVIAATEATASTEVTAEIEEIEETAAAVPRPKAMSASTSVPGSWLWLKNSPKKRICL